MRQFIFIVILLTWTFEMTSQHIVEVVQIEKDDGLKDRTVDRVIRDHNGYFILFMKNTIQRYDGKTFENIDIAPLKSNKIEVRDILGVDILTDGTIILHPPSKIHNLFYIANKQNRVSFTPLNGKALVNQSNLYLLKPKGLKQDSLGVFIHKAELKNHLVSEIISTTELEEDIATIACINDLIYLQDAAFNIQILKENHLIDLPVKGRLIQRENGVYLFDQDKIYKLYGSEYEVIKRLPDQSFECQILKVDKEDNIVAIYSGSPRFKNRVYVLDKKDLLHSMDNIIEVNNVFQDFYTDDAFHRWMLCGYNGLHIINLLSAGATFTMLSTIFEAESIANVVSALKM